MGEKVTQTQTLTLTLTGRRMDGVKNYMPSTPRVGGIILENEKFTHQKKTIITLQNSDIHPLKWTPIDICVLNNKFKLEMQAKG